jgi:uncharacterized membrane protein
MWIFWLTLFAVVMFLVRSLLFRNMPPAAGKDSPIDTLKQRYARLHAQGEIDDVEYQRRLRELKQYEWGP